MNSVGVFREKEIEGKLFLTFNFFSQKDNPSSSSSSSSCEKAIVSTSDSDLFLQPQFVCPSLRLKVEGLKLEEDGYSPFYFLPFKTSPHMEGGDKQLQCLLGSSNQYSICKQPVLPLFWCNQKPQTALFTSSYCELCKIFDTTANGYYLCVECDKIYHKECVESPLFIKNPSYPFLSLQLHPTKYMMTCIFCKENVYDMCYHCPIYDVTMHPICAMKSIPILSDHPKRHPHSLTFFPRQNSLACNVCGMVKPLIPTHVCARCDFVVHEDCINFPYVIRISRHHHRISFTYSLPSGNFSCGVCRKKIDTDYGAYSCNKCDGYFVHSRCALRRDLWDGEELEGVPEEVEIIVEPFEVMDDGTIRHFSHDRHHLKLEVIITYDDNKYCQACVLPIYEGNYYSCVDDNCHFILHETCANAPLKKHNPLHAHSLTLKVVTSEYEDSSNRGFFCCSACGRYSCGFVYDGIDPGGYKDFKLDLRCASISEPFNYEGHEHPLFLALCPEEEKAAACQICQTGYHSRKLNCIECSFVICFKCATIPYKVRYKHDKHFLTFRKAKAACDQSDWCEVCEKKIINSRESELYACNDYCCTSLHAECLVGKDMYMKHGQPISFPDPYDDPTTNRPIRTLQVEILRNNTMSRPFCHGSRCDDRRSLYRVYFKSEYYPYTFCSTHCLGMF